MSDLFDDDPREGGAPPKAPQRTRGRALAITGAVLVVAFLALSGFATIYTDRLWFVAVDYSTVFSTMYLTRILLFVVFGLVMTVAVGVNLWLAYRSRPLLVPQLTEQNSLDRYRDAILPIRKWLLIGVSLLVGAFAGTSAASSWRTYLLWRNGTEFGQDDPYFGRDIGFYVFELPWLHFVVEFAMAVLLISLIAAALVHYLYGGIRLQVSRDRFSSAAQIQLSLLLGLLVLVKAFDYWLDRFDLATNSSGLMTGLGYTDDHAVLPAKNILIGISVICAVLLFLNVWRRTWLLPSVGLALLVLSAVLLGMIWPGVVQQFQVRPSEPDREAPFLRKNMESTRAAYDIANVDREAYSSNSDPATADQAALNTQLASVPLVDPKLVRDTFEQNQQARAYYTVADVLDVDRYEIDGIERSLVLGVREMNSQGINPSDQNWSNLHTVYTHGNGLIAAFGNQRGVDNTTPADEIAWAEVGREVTDITNHLAEQSPDGSYEGRVYFGEQTDDYAIVGRPEGADPVELDLGRASGDGESVETQTTYDGQAGVEVGSAWRKLLYAVKYGEPNFILSDRVNENSKILDIRVPQERVQKVAPWLTLDQDAYPVIVEGRIKWVIDGYTTTDRYPGSERESLEDMTRDAMQDPTGLRTLPTDEINYMRNAVKVTVDAYDGTVDLYAWDEDEPILNAWRGAFPDTVKDKDEIPEALLAHLRYPEDLFKVQRYLYARYHVEDPGDFYQSNNRWQVPEDPNNTNTFQAPYRIFLNEQGEAAEEGSEVWSLTTVLVPRGRNNLAAFMSVNSDATSPDYGQLRIKELANANASGPGLISNEFNADETVRDALLPFGSGETAPRFGNLLTLPVTNGLIHIQPMYATRSASASAYPILQFVLISYGDSVGIGRTLTAALAQSLGVDPITTPPPADNGESGEEEPEEPGEPLTLDEQIQRAIQRADVAFTAADAALADQDLAEYQKQVQIAQRQISRAIDLAGERDSAAGDAPATETDEPADEPTEDGDE